MKTPPDETTLTLWMDGQLTGTELESMEAWAQQHPELLAERDAIQAMTQSIQDTLPSSQEPPYPDFFNQQIMKSIQEETSAATKASVSSPEKSGSIWRWLAAPLMAGSMAICFYLGTQFTGSPTTSPSTDTVASTPTVYTPDNGVQADTFVASNQQATVIVIEGLEDIPDDLDLKLMSGMPNIERDRSTASAYPQY